MGPPSDMRSVVDRNVVMRRIHVHGVALICTSCLFLVIRVSTPIITTRTSNQTTDTQTANETDNAIHLHAGVQQQQQQQQGECTEHSNGDQTTTTGSSEPQLAKHM